MNKVKSTVGSAIDFAKNLLGIHSPSRVFRDQVGKWIPLGIGAGIEQNTQPLLDTISDMTDDVIAEATNGMTFDASMNPVYTSNANGQVDIGKKLDLLSEIMYMLVEKDTNVYIDSSGIEDRAVNKMKQSMNKQYRGQLAMRGV